MFDSLKSLFSGDTAEKPADETLSAQTATAALMVEAAMADGVFTQDEEARIRRLLASGFDLSAQEAGQELDRAKALADTAVDHHKFTRVVKNLPKDERLKVVEDLWCVILADDENTSEEDSLMRRLGPLLAITDRERGEARHRAQARQH